MEEFMSAYAVGFYRIWDASWRVAYREKTFELVQKYGGKFLVRPYCQWEVLEGEPTRPTGMLMRISFDGEGTCVVQRS
jgi:uncharacterized protein (DUF1330 family)